jgi:hypothetical protein
MKDIAVVPYHATSERLVNILCQKTQNNDKAFFRVLVAYYFTKVASMMRANIDTPDRGDVPINLYAINLASSGQGKGFSTNIIEEQVIEEFRQRFIHDTFEANAKENLAKIALTRATKKETDEEDECKAALKEFKDLGELAFSFDSGTTAAVKQMRHKLLMAKAGSMNMEIDEIGSNLLGNIDVLKTFLELFDMGKVKQKLTKNTSENTRNEEIIGRTPTNMLLFGTPIKLMDGGKTEEEVMSMLETGMARRCFFGIDTNLSKNTELTPDEVYDMMTDTSSETYLQQLSADLADLADIVNFNVSLTMTKTVSLLLIEYKLECEKQANLLPDNQEIRKAEISHRYFKVLKLAGTYAFIDGSPALLEDHLYNAIKLAEDSGVAFKKLLSRDKPPVKLAKYLASVNKEVTHFDIVDDLPFYKGSEAQRRDILNLAIGYGYRNNIVIKKSFEDGIEFLKGESLAETNLKEMVLSYGNHMATGYRNELVPFEKLDQLTQQVGFHWVAHHLIDGHRREDNIIQGFNMVVIDCDGEVSMDTVKLLMKDYKYMLYTTKRHTDKKNRFRVIFPMSHVLRMDKPDYTEFMNNIYEWLPFEVDTGTVDRSRKWLTNAGHFEYNDGSLLSSLMFIPKTAKNEERQQFVADTQSLSNMERWFVNNTGVGNRSNQLIKFALLLVDTGMDFVSVQNNVLALNSKLQNKMKEAEIMSTILVTANRAIAKRDA